MGLPSSFRRFPTAALSSFTTLVAGVVLAGASIAACAKGDEADLGPALAETAEPTEPAAPGDKLPPPEGEDEDDDSGASSSGSSGSTDSGTDSAGHTDASVDAAKDSSTATCATVAPSNACGLSPQCGCAANQTCDVTTATTGAVSCVLAGGGTLGTYCTSSSQCAKGFTCGYNACRPYCPTLGAACVGAGLGECAQYYDSAGTAVKNSKVCTVACDPRSPAAACGSNNCIFDTTIDATDCDKSGTAGLYDACSRYNDCAQGLACVPHPLFGLECEEWCRIGQNDCGILETCEDVYGATAPTSGGVKLGHCQ